MEAKQPNSKLISLGVLVAVVLLVVAVSALNKKQEQAKADSAQITSAAQDATMAVATPNTVATTPTTPVESTQSTANAAYKAGTYSAEGSFQTPDGEEKIKITLTLTSDGTITSTTAVNEGQSRDSKEYQDLFIGGYKGSVVGKNISSLSLGNISGSSLTPIGFNKATTIIKSQATS